MSTAVLVLVGAISATTSAQQASPSLVFDGVTVVDVEHGKLVPDQRVVIKGTRIQTMGWTSVVKTPKGARVVSARGKYLIPGLWDMHTHSARSADLFYPLFLANGVTGIRDAGSAVPLDTLRLWRQEILAGTRVGPPRQILSGHSIMGPVADCNRSEWQREGRFQTCVTDTADARHVVDSLKAAGADMIKPRAVSTKAVYFAIASESRRLGIPFGGHITLEAIRDGLTYSDASDSGASIVDHKAADVKAFSCWGPSATVEQCRPIAERFRRNGTWWVPTLVIYDQEQLGPRSRPIYARFEKKVSEYWKGSTPATSPFVGALSDSARVAADRSKRESSAADSLGYGYVAQRVGMPILAGTDVQDRYLAAKWPQGDDEMLPGFSLHAELAFYAAEGLTPLTVLQSATLHPAKLLHGTDSLGTVAPGKLADLVLLDANPLADITNTTRIRAVVANGRYFDRATLDKLLADARAKAKRQP